MNKSCINQSRTVGFGVDSYELLALCIWPTPTYHHPNTTPDIFCIFNTKTPMYQVISIPYLL